MSLADSLYNLQLVQEFCREHLARCCHFALEDMLYAAASIKVRAPRPPARRAVAGDGGLPRAAGSHRVARTCDSRPAFPVGPAAGGSRLPFRPGGRREAPFPRASYQRRPASGTCLLKGLSSAPSITSKERGSAECTEAPASGAGPGLLRSVALVSGLTVAAIETVQGVARARSVDG